MRNFYRTSLAAFVYFASVSSLQGAIVMQADFDGSPLRSAGDAVSAGDLNAGTVGGTWTVNDDQESIIGSEVGDASNHALAGDRGSYDFELSLNASQTLTSGLQMSFDTQIIRTSNSANAKKNFVTGLDSLGSEVFQIVVTTDGTGTDRGRIKYVNQAGSEVTLINDLPSVNADATQFDIDDLTNVRIDFDATTMDIFISDVLLADDVDYRTAGVLDLAEITLVGSGSADSNAAGAWFDNVQVSAAVPEPTTLALVFSGLLVLSLRRRR